MSRVWALPLILFSVLMLFTLNLGAKAANAQTKQRKTAKTAKIAFTSRRYLVPPPPPYMPSWLPEPLYRRTAVRPQVQQQSNPYTKYIYTAPGHEEVTPVQSNKYITYWSKS